MCGARLRPEDFYQTNKLWTDPKRVDEPAYACLLNSELPLYGDTLNLQVRVVTQPVGRRPHFFVVNPQHPLALEQRDGISMARVIEIAEIMLH